MNRYTYEYTDTFAGEANYSWVRRGTVDVPELTHYGYTGSADGSYSRARRVADRELAKRVKAVLSLTNVRCDREDWGDVIVLRPRGSASIVFIEWDATQ